MKHLLIIPLAATLAISACNAEEKVANVADKVSEATESVKDAAATIKDAAGTVTDATSGKVADVAGDVKDAMTETKDVAVTETAETKDAAVAAVTETAETATKPSAFSTEKEKLGYAFGHQFAKNLVAGKLQESVSADTLAQAIKDAFSGAEPQMSDDEMRVAVEGFQAKAQAVAAEAAEAAKAKGTEFLAANKAKEGVVTTESGLQYIVLEEGKGATPADDKSVEVNYKGSLIDGTVFDSSYDRGQAATFPLNGVIPGFTEGLKLMKEGGKIKLFIPSDLAYGVQAPPSIGPNQALIFEIELIAVK